jgi:hypothetical protein
LVELPGNGKGIIRGYEKHGHHGNAAQGERNRGEPFAGTGATGASLS